MIDCDPEIVFSGRNGMDSAAAGARNPFFDISTGASQAGCGEFEILPDLRGLFAACLPHWSAQYSKQ
jgi:hypothetical protein